MWGAAGDASGKKANTYIKRTHRLVYIARESGQMHRASEKLQKTDTCGAQH